MVRRKCEYELKARESILTENYGLIRPILAAMCANMVLINMINNNFNTESRQLPFPYYELDFTQIFQTIFIWMWLLLLAFINYVMFKIWARYRIQLLPKSLFLKLWDILFLTGLGLDFVICLYAPLRYKTTMSFIASSLLSIEQFRIPMKIYAFVRSNVPNVLSYKPKADTDILVHVPEFSKYLYFFCAPTLIYRDHYPRTNQFRWRFFLTNFTDAVITGVFLCSLWESQFLSQFRDFGLKPATVHGIILRMGNAVIPSLLLMLLMFYFCLHCYSNLTAELLYFGDREFYTDWWHCTSCAEYTRTWNLIINNFIHTYIYRDVLVFVTRANKPAAMAIVYLISLPCHECFFAITVGYMCHCTTALFICVSIISGLLIKLEGKKYVGMLCAWLVYGWMTSMAVSILLLDHYARFNKCHQVTGTWKDFVLPGFLTCLENTP